MADSIKILFHYDAAKHLRETLAQLADRGLDVVCCPEGQSEPFNAEVVDAEVIWHVLEPVTAEVITRAPKLKLIQKIGVGVNTIDMDAAKEQGIAVCNMPGTNSRAVAEMALLLILSALRKQHLIDKVCRSGQWYTDKTIQETFGEIGGRTVGFVGYGEIPKILAPIVEFMGASVIYTDIEPKDNSYDFVSLEQLLSRADIVSLHVPLTAETDKLINADSITLMQPGSILINTARGELVDEGALYKALQEGTLSAAGLDVFNQEPVPKDNPLLSLDNVTVSPHVAWLTNETFDRSIDVCVQNSIAIRDGCQLHHQVI